MLSYECLVDAHNEYCWIGESTVLEAMIHWVVAIRACFGLQYLLQPTQEDVRKQIQVNSTRGFPSLFGSFDCMHWTWKKNSRCLAGAILGQGLEL
jgi:hypothetical protein